MAMLKLRHWKTFLPAQEGAAKVVAATWSPNSEKLAVCTVDRVILLYDEYGEQRDKFSTKPADTNLGKKSYQVSCLAFSPDSTRIAVGQTDNIIYVYRIGETWGEKKVICNKYILQSAVTCMLWPVQQANFVFGQADGKVRIAGAKGSKSKAVYSISSYTVSLALSPTGTGILSGHADGTIVRYLFEEEGSDQSKGGPICRHSCPPYGLVWTNSTILAAGCDKKITVYAFSGRIIQNFDHFAESKDREFMCAACNVTGESCVFGSYNRLRVLTYSSRKGAWEESPPKDIENLYTITSLSWRRDGSKIAVGSLCGAMDVFDCCVRRVMYKTKYELTYVSQSQVIVKDLHSGIRVIFKSHFGCEILQVQIMGKDRFLVAHTTNTLLIGDIQSCKLSEINWQSTDNEKFFCDNENVCLVYSGGELTLMEYGSSDVLGSVRTEFVSSNLISVRVNERKQKDMEQCKRLAYLLDLHTICIKDLYNGITLANITHDSKIDWLKLNETGKKLLFRDKKCRLNIFDLESQTRTALLNYCSYVQWVPQSDVVVAQNRSNLCVWYNIEMPDKITMFPLKGEVVSLDRRNGRTEVKVQAGAETTCYTLDEGLIEFGTAVDDGDYLRALNFLETLELNKETEAMWKTLADLTLSARELIIAQRCYAALGDVSKARYLEKVLELARTKAAELGKGDGTDHYQVRAKLAILNKQFKTAEDIYLEKGEVEQAMAMYRELHHWEDAIAIASSRNHPELDSLRSSYFQWLLGTGQDERAGEMREREGDLNSAITLYMKAGLPAKAAKLVMHHQELYQQPDLLQQVSTALVHAGLYEKAGDLFMRANKLQQALESYRAGCSFRRAIELARTSFPAEVVVLEEQWGDYLSEQKQHNNSIAHYIEAGCLEKAVTSAMLARQWVKAIQILSTQDPEACQEYYLQIAKHFASVKDFKQAEAIYSRAGLVKEIANMYLAADLWDQAFHHAQSCMDPSEVKELYLGHGHQLEEAGKHQEAEKLYMLVGEPGLAINMYQKAKQYDSVIRLVSNHKKELLHETYAMLAKELENEGNLRKAEKYYLDGNNWSGAVTMYRNRNLWDDAYRVAKSRGGSTASNKVAYYWAKTLGGDSAVKLLTKFGVLEVAVVFATESFDFDFAFAVAKAAVKSKIPDVHMKYALYLEDEGKFEEAEAEFIKAGRPKEAVLMHIHKQDWEAAQKVAELHCPDNLPDVLAGQAKVAFERKDFQKAEALYLQAERPDLIAIAYKEADMGPDALRIVKDYLPAKLEEFQRDLALSAGVVSYNELLTQARTWEQSGEYIQAVNFYLRLNSSNCPDRRILLQSWEKAVDLAVKFLPKPGDVASMVCERLAEMGEYSAAGELMLTVENIKEALDYFMAGEGWTRARDIAKNVAPRYQQYVEDAYVVYLKEQKKAEEMSSVDPEGALKLYIQKGQWDQCIELAREQGSEVLRKYVALYAATLIRDGKAPLAIQLFNEHGCSPNPENFNIYKHLCAEVYKQPFSGKEGYPLYSTLRNMLLRLVENLSRTDASGGDQHKEFEQHLMAVHYLASRAAFHGVEKLEELVAKLSVSLLRHTNHVQADKAFYEAGTLCRAVGWESMAFVFYNRFLDLSEAIEDGSLDALDNSDFIETDIPFDVPLPETPYMPEANREDVKEWVLALSMDNRVEQALPVDERGTYVGSLYCPHTEVVSLPCVITGYPVLRHKIEFKMGLTAANKEDWNAFIMAVKTHRTEECMDVWKFISTWCGAPSTPSYSFN